MNTQLECHNLHERLGSRQKVAVPTRRSGQASSDADEPAGNREAPIALVNRPRSSLGASTPQSLLKPSKSMTQLTMNSASCPSENAEDVERDQRLPVVEAQVSRKSNNASSLSQKSLVARFFEYVSSQEMKRSLQSAEQDQVVDGWLNANPNPTASKSKYKEKLLKVLRNVVPHKRIEEPLIDDEAANPQSLSFQNIHYNSDDGLQKAEI